MKFDLSTGRAENGECALKTYPTRLSATGQILIDVSEDA